MELKPSNDYFNLTKGMLEEGINADNIRIMDDVGRGLAMSKEIKEKARNVSLMCRKDIKRYKSRRIQNRMQG